MIKPMEFIRSTQFIQAARPGGKTIVYMLGYGGYAWQAKRHLKVLRAAGYNLFVLDFRDVLKRRDPQDLLTLVDEVSAALAEQKLINKDTILVGISLGGLVGYNLIRRYAELDKLLVITGGDMTRIPSAKALQITWKLTRSELAARWSGVNIYTPIGALAGKHIVMLLPLRDRVIDPEEVTREIANHTALNDFQIVRTKGGHFRTIITETIISPRKSLGYIEELARL
jgi:pimeloyl-ACP methyl ester carboxylesterase